jgi:hypothetical protein
VADELGDVDGVESENDGEPPGSDGVAEDEPATGAALAAGVSSPR